MLATQLLFGQGALAMPEAVVAGKPIQCSPRGVLPVIRAEFSRVTFRTDFGDRLSKARRDTRARTTDKDKRRVFPGRTTHKPPLPPVILPLPDDLKPYVHKYFQAA
jgi:hypothetical protein